MHLVGYLYKDYHDARSFEHKIIFSPDNYKKQFRKLTQRIFMLERAVHRAIAVFVGAICHSTKFALRVPVYDSHVGYVMY
jgi:hypothetical protein